MKIDFSEKDNLYCYNFIIPEDTNKLQEYKKILESQIKNNSSLFIRYYIANSALFLTGISIINLMANNDISVAVSSLILNVAIIKLFIKNKNIGSINKVLQGILDTINEAMENKKINELDFSVPPEFYKILEENINLNKQEGNQKTKK